MLSTMVWQSLCLSLLDQTGLPHKIEYITCTDYRRVATAIKRLEVRGAPAIGAAAAFGMVLAFKEYSRKSLSKESLLKSLLDAKNELVATRPTAVNLEWAADKIYAKAECALLQEIEWPIVESVIEAEAIKIHDDDIRQNKLIGNFGAALLPQEAVILTHCNAGSLATCGWGTALGVIRQAQAENKVKMVYVDETRPLLQGARLTAWELLQDGVPATLITDNMAGWTMKQKHVNAVIVGADRIAANGDTANKIGTYGLAVLAKYHGIPFYIAAPSSTFDFACQSGQAIPIEERDAAEVKEFCGFKTTPQAINGFNPSFDVTPNDLITAIITEHGVLQAPFSGHIQDLQQKVKE